MFGRLFRNKNESPAPVIRRSVPAGECVYAVGDIHGRLDLLDRLLADIDADCAARGAIVHHIIFLGDLIDRGADSAGVVTRLMAYRQAAPNVRLLLGNHEEVLLLALEGNREALRLFDRIGGRETLLSYGVSAAELIRADFDRLEDILRHAIPQEHIDFLQGFEDMIVIGDYVFVHAGINPRLSLDKQRVADLRWIRDRFLDHDGPLEKMVVHGHTIAREVEWRPNRIGIDTGAFVHGRLTALCLQDDRQWLMQVDEHQDAVPSADAA